MNSNHSRGIVPRAHIHKKILDEAERRPNGTVDAIAAEVTAASPGLVESVLDEYSDPAHDSTPINPESGGSSALCARDPPASESSDVPEAEESDSSADSSTTDDDSDPVSDGGVQRSSLTIAETELDGDGSANPLSKTPGLGTASITLSELDDKQLQVLEAIRSNPDATQAELADELDVSPATVCNWVNTVPNFEWRFREHFVSELFDDAAGDEETTTTTDPKTNEKMTETTDQAQSSESTATHESTSPDEQPIEELTTMVDSLSEQVSTITERIESMDEHVDESSISKGQGLVINDPELIQRLLHMVVRSDEFTEEEEMALIETLVEA